MAQNITELFGALPDIASQFDTTQLLNLIKTGDPYATGAELLPGQIDPNSPIKYEEALMMTGNPDIAYELVLDEYLRETAENNISTPPMPTKDSSAVAAANMVLDLRDREIWVDNRGTIFSDVSNPTALGLNPATDDDVLKTVRERFGDEFTEDELVNEIVKADQRNLEFGLGTGPSIQAERNKQTVREIAMTSLEDPDITSGLTDASFFMPQGAMTNEQVLALQQSMPALGMPPEMPTTGSEAEQAMQQAFIEYGGTSDPTLLDVGPGGESLLDMYPEVAPSPEQLAEKAYLESFYQNFPKDPVTGEVITDPNVLREEGVLGQGLLQKLGTDILRQRQFGQFGIPSADELEEEAYSEAYASLTDGQKYQINIGATMDDVLGPYWREQTSLKEFWNLGENRWVTDEETVTPADTTTAVTPVTTSVSKDIQKDIANIERMVSSQEEATDPIKLIPGVGATVTAPGGGTTPVNTPDISAATAETIVSLHANESSIIPETDARYNTILTQTKNPSTEITANTLTYLQPTTFLGNATELFYSDSDKKLYGKADETLYDLGTAYYKPQTGISYTPNDQATGLSWVPDPETNLWAQPSSTTIAATQPQEMTGMGGVPRVTEAYVGTGRPGWQQWYGAGRMKGMGTAAALPQFQRTALHGFRSDWGRFQLNQASGGVESFDQWRKKKSDDSYIPRGYETAVRASADIAAGRLAISDAELGGNPVGYSKIKDVLANATDQEILDIISAAHASNPDTYGGKAFQGAVADQLYLYKQSALARGESPGGFLQHWNKYADPNSIAGVGKTVPVDENMESKNGGIQFPNLGIG